MPGSSQRLDYPQYVIEIDQSAASALRLTQMDVMQNIVAAFNSSVQFNKKNFWIDPKSHNQYYVGVQYPESETERPDTLLDIPDHESDPEDPDPVAERGHPAQDQGSRRRDPHEPAADHGPDHGRPRPRPRSRRRRREPGPGDKHWRVADGPMAAGPPTTRTAKDQMPMEGAKLILSGEYQKMQDTFRYQAMGMAGAVLLIYFLMVALFRSYITPLVVLSAVPVGVVGVVLVLFFTGTALNVQSLLGVIFMVGIVVSNTVLLTDFAENLRKGERLTPTEAIRRAAAIRVRPVVMTALATFLALIPMAIGLSRGSEANVPLGRAVLGGLVAGLLTTLLVVPCVYSLVIPNKFEEDEELPGDAGHNPSGPDATAPTGAATAGG